MSLSLAPAATATVMTALTAMLVTTGRCSRKGLLVCALVLLALQGAALALMLAAGIAHDGALGWMVGGVFLWLSTCAVAKRLHDLGLSARRIAWAALAVVVWSTVLAFVLMVGLGPEAMQPGGAGMTAAVVGTSLPVFALTLWLHLKPGMSGPNRYGIEPDDSGFCGGLPLSGPVQVAPPAAPTGEDATAVPSCAQVCYRQSA